MSYTVDIQNAAEKDMKSIPAKDRDRIHAKIVLLAEEPRPRQSKKLKETDIIYRLRVGDYRVIYAVDDKKKTVAVARVAHRKEAYQ